MVEKPSIPPSNLPKSTPLPQGGAVPSSKGRFEAKPMTFCGMYFDAPEATKLWDIIVRTLCDKIQKDGERALKELKKDWGKKKNS